MKIIVVGTGFVGLTHAATTSEYGHEVYAYDIDKQRIAAYQSADPERIEHYVNEPGLANIIADNIDRYLFFTTDIEPIIEGTDAIFLCLPTPPNPERLVRPELLLRRAQLYRRAAGEAQGSAPRGADQQEHRADWHRAPSCKPFCDEHNVPNAGIASNPEFLPEGDAVEKSRKPDRVVVGADTEDDFRILRRIYSQFVNHVRIRYIETTPETAEAIKYVANTLLLTYISFWNGVGARLGETFDNVRMEDLKRGVTADARISTWGSYVSNGAGGSCFGKDIQSLIYQFKSAGQPADLLQSVYDINEYQKTYLIDRAVSEGGVNFNQKTVALLGLSFKQRTNDMRDSSSLKVVEALLGRGVSAIRAYDPLAMREARRYFNPDNNHLFDKISYHDSAKEAISGSDMLFISTDWEEFRGLSRTIEQTVKPPYLVMDGRRMIPDYTELVERGYSYLAVGSCYMAGKVLTT